MKRIIITGLVIAGIAMAYLKAYEVEPLKAEWSGWAPGEENCGVGQIITCNFDSMVYCELFVGWLGQSPQNKFNAEVWEVNGPLVARKYDVDPPDRDHKWLRFDLEPIAGQKFVREANLTQAEAGFIIF